MRACCFSALLTIAMAAPAAASTYAVDPTRIVFGARSTSQLLTIRNDSGDTLRFQLSVFSWQQTESGEMQLTPSQDVVAFPTLLVLKPREERRVRVGLTTRSGSLEKSYRIFVEELPPLEDGSADRTGVRVLTRMGIPVFVQPAKPTAVATLTDLSSAKALLRFSLKNEGNVHFIAGEIKVRGLDGGGRTLFETPLSGWYVLAGGVRTFATEIPAAHCGALASLTVDAKVNEASLQESIKVSPAACRQ